MLIFLVGITAGCDLLPEKNLKNRSLTTPLKSRKKSLMSVKSCPHLAKQGNLKMSRKKLMLSRLNKMTGKKGSRISTMKQMVIK